MMRWISGGSQGGVEGCAADLGRSRRRFVLSMSLNRGFRMRRGRGSIGSEFFTAVNALGLRQYVRSEIDVCAYGVFWGLYILLKFPGQSVDAS